MLLTPTGARWELHAILAIVVSVGFGVIAAKTGYPEFSPYAALTGVAVYVILIVVRIAFGPHRSRWRSR